VSLVSISIADDFGLCALGLLMSLESIVVTYHIVLGIWSSPIWIRVWISWPWPGFKAQVGYWF
jgi:hypothetical protein